MPLRTPPVHRAAIAAALFLSPAAGAQVLDFESGPGVDDTPIANQFVGSHGIGFALDNNLDFLPDPGAAPFLERVGNDGSDAFTSSFFGTGVNDMARTDRPESLGTWFLRPPSQASTSTLLAVYTAGSVFQAGGEIWDIDIGQTISEQWRVSAFDAAGALLGTVDSPLGTTDNPLLNIYESGAWTWSLTAPSGGNPIRFVRIRFIGASVGAGVGFDNFTAAVPTPPATLLLAGAALALSGRRRRMR